MRRECYVGVKTGRFFLVGSLRGGMNTTNQAGDTSMSAGDGDEAGRIECTIHSVNGCLHEEMDMNNKTCNPTLNSEILPKVEQANKDCSMNSVNVPLRYEMTSLGAYVSILEFDMGQRFYRYLDEYYDRQRAKVMDHLRVMVFIPFR